jgi:AcrR family transcriptional regulator
VDTTLEVEVGPVDDGELRREEILEAALALFSEHGYRGTTIKAIAAQANLRSSALLYWYFTDKEAILRACLERFGAVLVDPEAEHEQFDQPPQEFLPRVMHGVLQRVGDDRTVAALRIVSSEATLLAERGFHLDAVRPVNLFSVLRDYLQHQVRQGNLRPHDSSVVARMLVGQLTLSIQTRGATASMLSAPIDAQVLVQETLQVLLHGLSRDSGPTLDLGPA